MKSRRSNRFFPLAAAVLVAAASSCAASGPSWEQYTGPVHPAGIPADGALWKTIVRPDALESPAARCGEPGFLWVRGTIEVARPVEGEWGVYLGRVRHLARIFVNGVEAGRTTPDEYGNVHEAHGFLLGPGVVRKGGNTVVVELGVFGCGKGGLADGVSLLPRVELARAMKISAFAYDQVPFAVALLMMLLMIPAAGLALWRNEVLFLIAALILGEYTVYVLAVTLPLRPFLDPPALTALLWASIPTMALLLTYLAQALYGNYYRAFNVMAAGTAGALCAALAACAFLRETAPMFPLGLAAVVASAPAYAYLMVWLGRRKGDPFTRRSLGFFFAANVAIAALETVLYAMGSANITLPTIYTSPFLVTGFMMVTARNYARRLMKMELLYHELRISATEKRSLTEDSRRKVDQVLEFIRHNYKESLSREGMASAAGVNPDHLSRIFNAHTGKRINEYIHELRVTEACRLLTETGTSVIDVAFTVGYESLTTFNRTFARILGISPAEYRRRQGVPIRS